MRKPRYQASTPLEISRKNLTDLVGSLVSMYQDIPEKNKPAQLILTNEMFSALADTFEDDLFWNEDLTPYMKFRDVIVYQEKYSDLKR